MSIFHFHVYRCVIMSGHIYPYVSTICNQIKVHGHRLIGSVLLLIQVIHQNLFTKSFADINTQLTMYHSLQNLYILVPNIQNEDDNTMSCFTFIHFTMELFETLFPLYLQLISWVCCHPKELWRLHHGDCVLHV